MQLRRLGPGVALTLAWVWGCGGTDGGGLIPSDGDGGGDVVLPADDGAVFRSVHRWTLLPTSMVDHPLATPSARRSIFTSTR